MNNTLIYVAYKKDSVDVNGMKNPACIFKFYHNTEREVLGSPIIAYCEQVFARKNKKIEEPNVSVEDFKGDKGVTGVFYNERQLKGFLDTLLDDGYATRRIVPHLTNDLAEEISKYLSDKQFQKVHSVV